ncbi:MAG: 3-oxoacyl-ACP reductase FabG [bacterium]|nr:3-oxoacyl-ACP reductase FabG [bacterium]
MPSFQNKKALVTGATRGIGRATTLSLLAEGAQVYGLFGGNQEAAEALAAEVKGLGYDDKFFLQALDVSDFKAVSAFFTELEADWDTLDILVNSAGIRRDAVVPMLKEEDWRRVLDVNLSGCFNTSKAALPLMLKQKYGRIIFITSPMGHLGFPGQANYAASKAGQIGLMKSLSKEVAKRRITVNCVSPGFIDTDFLAGLAEEQLKQYKKMVPTGRFGTAAEVADAVLFLAGDKAAYINGAVLEITGGL